MTRAKLLLLKVKLERMTKGKKETLKGQWLRGMVKARVAGRMEVKWSRFKHKLVIINNIVVNNIKK